MCFVHRFNSMSQILSYLAKFHCLRKCVFLISSSTVGFILHWLFSFSFWFATFYAGSVNAHTHWLTPIYTHPHTPFEKGKRNGKKERPGQLACILSSALSFTWAHFSFLFCWLMLIFARV